MPHYEQNGVHKKIKSKQKKNKKNNKQSHKMLFLTQT